MNDDVTCVVPARLGSTRFFRKLLAPIFDKPVIVHTLERALGAGCFARVVCLTDSVEIGEAAAAHGFEWVLSDERAGDAANGTERIARALNDPRDVLQGDLFVNLQGDEPAFPEDGLRTLCAALRAESGAAHLLVHDDEPSATDLANPNRVKVAVDAHGLVTGFSRTAPAPTGAVGVRPDAPPVATGTSYRLQLGAYAYHRDYLTAYAALPPSAAEIELSHEMLRAPGLAPLRAHPARPGASVDVPEDLARAERALEARATRAAPTGSAAPPVPPALPAPVIQNMSTSALGEIECPEQQPRLQGASA